LRTWRDQLEYIIFSASCEWAELKSCVEFFYSDWWNFVFSIMTTHD